MKKNLIISITFILFSCINKKDDASAVHQIYDTLTPLQSSFIFHDNDSIYKQSFKAVSNVKNDWLYWKINFFENNKLEQQIIDSIKGLSYLVKAVDLNNDSIGELVFVTGYFKKGTDSTEYLKCRIFCYTKESNKWICQEIPPPSDNLQNENSSEVVEVGKKSIIRKIRNKSGIQKRIIYGLNNKGKLFIR
ncbi:MAG: hypothetical protein J7604_21180 [Sporocytophaga sp.]|uniref:hypothetical protein n=1 Tax=Sporocytophaga sp. TaxID=2231183 RepID=UPI001B163EC3|nr:hypothetical protein [Sporocytophaga sp.]MBO9702739.1 hypothetical protein [Sporocytophaga sp.]